MNSISQETLTWEAPENNNLFQTADLICSIKLIESKLAVNGPMPLDESRFFRGARIFKHDILRAIKRHEI